MTCKIRILPDMTQTLSLVRTIVGTGVEALAVHGRTKDERPNHDVHVDAIQVVSLLSAGFILFLKTCPDSGVVWTHGYSRVKNGFSPCFEEKRPLPFWIMKKEGKGA